MTEAEQIEALQNAFWQVGETLLLHHTNPWELDDALTAYGYGIGPCEAQDLLGLDRVLARRPKGAGCILSRMISEGRLGKIGGVGYYRYPGGGGAVIDPLTEDLIREEAHFAKVDRTEISNSDIVNVMNTALRQTLNASDIDPLLIVKAVYFPTDRHL